jgi:AbrB family looped-hinge helix DNA binding protein
MVAKVSVKGQTVIPEAIREQAHIRKGDELDVGYANGLIVMRKRQPLNASLIQSLLLSGSRLPDMTAENESAVARAIQRVRRKRKPCLRRIACSSKDDAFPQRGSRVISFPRRFLQFSLSAYRTEFPRCQTKLKATKATKGEKTLQIIGLYLMPP